VPYATVRLGPYAEFPTHFVRCTPEAGRGLEARATLDGAREIMRV